MLQCLSLKRKGNLTMDFLEKVLDNQVTESKELVRLYNLRRIFVLIPHKKRQKLIKKRQKLQFNDFNPTAT